LPICASLPTTRPGWDLAPLSIIPCRTCPSPTPLLCNSIMMPNTDLQLVSLLFGCHSATHQTPHRPVLLITLVNPLSLNACSSVDKFRFPNFSPSRSILERDNTPPILLIGWSVPPSVLLVILVSTFPLIMNLTPDSHVSRTPTAFGLSPFPNVNPPKCPPTYLSRILLVNTRSSSYWFPSTYVRRRQPLLRELLFPGFGYRSILEYPYAPCKHN